jgi:hypothetical protein
MTITNDPSINTLVMIFLLEIANKVSLIDKKKNKKID